jgi:hypothetical protein
VHRHPQLSSDESEVLLSDGLLQSQRDLPGRSELLAKGLHGELELPHLFVQREHVAHQSLAVGTHESLGIAESESVEGRIEDLLSCGGESGLVGGLVEEGHRVQGLRTAVGAQGLHHMSLAAVVDDERVVLAVSKGRVLEGKRRTEDSLRGDNRSGQLPHQRELPLVLRRRRILNLFANQSVNQSINHHQYQAYKSDR